MLIYRPRWPLVLMLAGTNVLIFGAVVGLAATLTQNLALTVMLLILASVLVTVSILRMRRRTLQLTGDGLVVQRDTYRATVRWADFECVRQRRIGLVRVDELVFRDGRAEPIDRAGRSTRAPLPKIDKIGANRRIQVGVYCKRWQDGPLGQAVRERELRTD